MQVDEDFNIRFVGLVKKYRCLYDKKVPEYRNKDFQEKAWQEISEDTHESILHCKERWRNLRACLSRYIKQQSSSDPQHKPYYLTEHMAYLLPFLKSRRQSMGNNSSYNFYNSARMAFKSSKYTDADDNNSSFNFECKKYIQQFSETSERRQHDNNSDTESTNSVDFTQAVEVEMKIPSQELIFPNSNDGAIPTTHYSKRIKLEPIACNNGLDGSGMEASSSCENDMDFFRSILPDLYGMTAQQKRKFKIGILELIDDVLEKYPADKININGNDGSDPHINGYWKK